MPSEVAASRQWDICWLARLVLHELHLEVFSCFRDPQGVTPHVMQGHQEDMMHVLLPAAASRWCGPQCSSRLKNIQGDNSVNIGFSDTRCCCCCASQIVSHFTDHHYLAYLRA